MEPYDFYQTLVQRYLNKSLSDEELEVFMELAKQGKLDVQLMEAMDKEINLLLPQKKSFRLWYRLAAVASILIVLSIGIFFYLSPYKISDTIAENDIKAGGFKAMLTLSNGKKIPLTGASDGKLTDQGGIEITKTNDGQLIYQIRGKEARNKGTILFNTINTPRGGKYGIKLPDGTMIWLNAESSLKFPTTFTGLSERRVELSGEAYFEVAKLTMNKNQNIPFIVATNKQTIEVLGTHFNVSNYINEPIAKTTLLEGSVAVSAHNSHNKQILKPGEQSLLTSGSLVISKVDTDIETAWKEGNFNFEDESIQSIMRKLERWYDIEVVYDGPMNNDTFGGKISVNRPLSKTLQLLESTGTIHFKTQGRRVTVMQ
ncbi:transmembrane sensor [Pedobacter africanus]|uniref:Uncharacterized protein n=1 Tax=Pedobacter africanus TaxID=151894 RepID=A0ACC6L258_9SPHI|nr:FecR family protein [Pedobacter africanus]MDR6785522.1 hypothetical protein [Pedobacter africanus]